MTSTPPPPPPAGPGAADGFFDSLRRMNTPRSQERWIGGVAGGIAARLGIDPLIVRGVFLVITLFGGFGLLVYGLAWALLPEASDGRIHLQEAIRGRFDAALVGAAVFTVIGLSRVGFWWDGWVGIPFMIGMIALVALAVVVITAIRNSGRSAPPGGGTATPPGGGTPSPGGGTPPTAHPTSGGHVPHPTAHPEQSGAAGFTAVPGTETRQITSGQAGSPDPAGPWSDEYAGGPWAHEPADRAESDGGAAPPEQEPAAGPADATEQPATAEPLATEHPATETEAHASAPADSGAASAVPEEAANAPVAEGDASAHSVPPASLAADATPTVAYPRSPAATSALPEDAADQSTTWPPRPQTTGAAAWAAGSGGAPPTGPPPPTTPPPPAAASQQPPKPPRRNRPGPGRVLVRLTFGLALLAIAGLVLAAHYLGWESSPWLVALGGGLVVLGLGATLAGLLGRRSASLGVVGTLLAIVLVPWAISAPVLTQYNFTDSANYGDRYWSPQTPGEAADGYSLAAGSIRVDLSDLAEEQVTSPIGIELGAGEVELLVPDGMPVVVTTSVQGETSTVNLADWSAMVNDERRDIGHRTELGWRFGTTPMITELTSPEAEGADPIAVNIDVGFGAVEVRELP